MMREGRGAGLGATSPKGASARGWFPAFNCGVSMGMGNPHPVQLDPKNMTEVLERLVGHKSVRRMAMYQNGKFFCISHIWVFIPNSSVFSLGPKGLQGVQKYNKDHVGEDA
jgi:hypothetical protein